MAINFPDSPTNDQSATLGGNTWTYNSTSGAWARASSGGGSSITTYDSTTDLPLTGVSAGDQAFVTGSNRMYVSNGTGWYSVSLVNTNPSITSVQDSDGGTTPFTLATDGAGTVITITASDPEDVPLTYNYSVTSGSLTNGGGTSATVVQGTDSDVNKFTITPTTTEAYAGTFELTFTTSDGINQASSVSSFTLSFSEDHFFVNHTNHGASTVNPSAVGLNSTGLNLYLKGYAGDAYIYKWSLGTAYELGTIPNSYTQRYSDSTVSTGRGFYVKSDGTKIFHFDAISITTISMTTANDLSTASHTTNSNTAQGNQIRGGHPHGVSAITFSHDGSKFYQSRQNGFASTYKIHEHNLTTPWDVSNTSIQDSHTSFDHNLGNAGAYGMYWSNNGLKFWASNGTTIKEWTTTVAYSTANFGTPTTYSYSNLITSAVNQTSGGGKTFSSYNFNSIWFSSNGRIMYICVNNSGGGPGILKFTLTTANTLADGFVF